MNEVHIRPNKVCNYNNLLDAAGATLRLMSLKMYSGRALIATITATFQAKVRVTTNVRSGIVIEHQHAAEGMERSEVAGLPK